MKQRGNLDFDFVKSIECVVLILVYKPLQPQQERISKSAIQYWFPLKKTFGPLRVILS